MSRRDGAIGVALTLVIILLFSRIRLPAAEPGDVDGDGRLSIGDVVHLLEGRAPVAGSLDAFTGCFESTDGSEIASSIYLESLRRLVPNALPHWFGVWKDDVRAEPAPEEPEVNLEILPMRATPDGFVEVRIVGSAEVAVHAFSMVLDTPGQLLQLLPLDRYWSRRAWRGAGINADSRFFSGRWYDVSIGAFLVTNGRYVINFNLDQRQNPWGPGQWEVVAAAVLPPGTPAGEYPVSLYPATEVLLEDRRVVSPVIEGDLPDEEGHATLIVPEEVGIGLGWVDEIPPLRSDADHRRVLGKIEFRLVDEEGKPAPPGEPLVSVMPGESFAVRVQVRTEVPLNQLAYTVRWLDDDLSCRDSENLFVNPEDGREYVPTWIRCLMNAAYELEGGGGTENYPGEVFRYFEPLGEWVDLVEHTLEIAPEAAGGQRIAIEFSRDVHQRGLATAAYSPYDAIWWCANPPSEPYWQYDVRWEDAEIEVAGAQPPPPPPPLGISLRLEDVYGLPGDTVTMPVLVSAAEPLGAVRVALAADPERLLVRSLELSVENGRTGDIQDVLVDGRGFQTFQDCSVDDDGDGVPDCVPNHPSGVVFWDTPSEFTLVDWFPGPGRGFPGRDLVEIGRLRVRIPEDAVSGDAFLRAARVPHTVQGLATEGETGGWAEGSITDGSFVAADQVSGGKVEIVRELLRGDADGDGRANITDAVVILETLFRSPGDPGCLEGADADDSGSLEITDAIALLVVLFRGQGELPPPHPDCGREVGGAYLGCTRSGCEG